MRWPKRREDSPAAPRSTKGRCGAVQNGIIGNDITVTGAVIGAVTLFGINEVFNRAAYASRRGMAVRGGVLVRAFAGIGWPGGGRWRGTPDYQHFSASGG